MIRAEIVVCRCGRNRAMFGIRAEEKQGNRWDVNWAFPLSENRAKAENYVATKINGSFNFTEKYPGCPHCGNTGIFKCNGCGAVTCWDCESNHVVCSGCGSTLTLSGTISELTTGGDR